MATDYQVVKAKVIAVLETRVLAQIALGWEPVGGVCYGINELEADAEAYLLQAMVKP
jgi:hypothetical protein